MNQETTTFPRFPWYIICDDWTLKAYILVNNSNDIIDVEKTGYQSASRSTIEDIMVSVSRGKSFIVSKTKAKKRVKIYPKLLEYHVYFPNSDTVGINCKYFSRDALRDTLNILQTLTKQNHSLFVEDDSITIDNDVFNIEDLKKLLKL